MRWIGLSNCNDRAARGGARRRRDRLRPEPALARLHRRRSAKGEVDACTRARHRVPALVAAGRHRQGRRHGRGRPGAPAPRTHHGVSPQQVALAWLLSLGPTVIPIPGASRPESITDSARAAELELSRDELDAITEAAERSRWKTSSRRASRCAARRCTCCARATRRRSSTTAPSSTRSTCPTGRSCGRAAWRSRAASPPARCAGARVLELGCGLGLPSLAAALAGGRVLATDWSPQAIELLHEQRGAQRRGARDRDRRLGAPRARCWSARRGTSCSAPTSSTSGATSRRCWTLLPPLLGERGELWLADPGRAPAEDFLAALRAAGARSTDGRGDGLPSAAGMRTRRLPPRAAHRPDAVAQGRARARRRHRGDHADAAARLAHDAGARRGPHARPAWRGWSPRCSRRRCDDVLLVGNDTGGAIAQLVAAHHPERVGGLVLTNCDAYERFFPPLFRPLQYAARVPGGVEAIAASLRVPAVRRLPIAYGKLAKRPIERAVTDAWAAPSRDRRHPARPPARPARRRQPPSARRGAAACGSSRSP